MRFDNIIIEDKVKEKMNNKELFEDISEKELSKFEELKDFEKPCIENKSI